MNSKPQMKSSAYERIAQQKEIEKKKLIKSADLYAEICDKDKELRKLTESAIAEWPE